MAIISEYNMRRIVDIYGGVQDRDLGGVSGDVERIVNGFKKNLPRGTSIVIRGRWTLCAALIFLFLAG